MALGAVLVLAACESSVAGQGTTASGGVDTVPLSIESIREISGFVTFTRVLDDDETVPDNDTPAGPCRALFDPAVAYGADSIGYRRVADEGDLYAGGPAPLIASVGQAVVAYPSAAASASAFGARARRWGECADLGLAGLGGTVSRPDANTVVYAADGWTLVSVVESAAIVDVSVGALPDDERVALDIAAAIVDRVPAG